MKKLAILLCVTCIIFAACGDPLIEMTDTQTELATTYAAGMLLKYSTAGKKGLVYVSPSVYEETEETSTAKPEEVEDEAPQDETADYLSDDAKTSLAASKPLEEVYDFGGADLSYDGYTREDAYVEGDYFSLTPDRGKEFLVLHLTLTNTGSAELNLDPAGNGVEFSAVINGKNISAEKTYLLEEDLTALKDRLEPGQSREGILIFQVDAATDVTSLELKASHEGQVGALTLES